MIDSVLMEEFLSLAEANLSVNGRHAGIRLPGGQSTQEDVQRARDTSSPFVAGDPVYFNFADDTYVLADTPVSMSYTCSVVACEYASAGLFVHPSKSEVIFAEGHAAPKVLVWTHEEVQQ